MKRQTAIIVGVGPALGSALVRLCISEGMRVVAVARSVSTLPHLQEHAESGQLLLHDCDATQPEAVSSLFCACDRTVGPPDLVVINTGAFSHGSVTEIDPKEFEYCWRVGCFAGFLVGQAAARRMLTTGHGSIVFTGATASLRGRADFVNLAAPKFALRAVAQSMARELGPKGLHIAHVIVDGQIRSGHGKHTNDQESPDSYLDPHQVAAAYLSLHRQHRSAWTFELDLRPWVERF